MLSDFMIKPDDKLPKSRMTSGVIKQEFIDGKTPFLLDKALKEFFTIFYHVDTYYRKEQDLWRVQGYFKVSDYLKLKHDYVPKELELFRDNMELVERDNSPTIEVWSLIIKDQYPF